MGEKENKKEYRNPSEVRPEDIKYIKTGVIGLGVGTTIYEVGKALEIHKDIQQKENNLEAITLQEPAPNPYADVPQLMQGTGLGIIAGSLIYIGTPMFKRYSKKLAQKTKEFVTNIKDKYF